MRSRLNKKNACLITKLQTVFIVRTLNSPSVIRLVILWQNVCLMLRWMGFHNMPTYQLIFMGLGGYVKVQISQWSRKRSFSSQNPSLTKYIPNLRPIQHWWCHVLYSMCECPPHHIFEQPETWKIFMYTEKHLGYKAHLIKSHEVHSHTRYSVQSLPSPFTDRYYITFGPSGCQCEVFQDFSMGLVSACIWYPLFWGLAPLPILHQTCWLPYTSVDPRPFWPHKEGSGE